MENCLPSPIITEAMSVTGDSQARLNTITTNHHHQSCKSKMSQRKWRWRNSLVLIEINSNFVPPTVELSNSMWTQAWHKISKLKNCNFKVYLLDFYYPEFNVIVLTLKYIKMVSQGGWHHCKIGSGPILVGQSEWRPQWQPI